MSFALSNNSMGHGPQALHDEPNEGYELRHYFRVLRRRKFSVIVPVVLCAIAAFVLTDDDKPTFESKAEVLLQPVSPAGTVAASAADARSARGRAPVSTEIAILNSAGVKEATQQALKHTVDVSVAPLNDDADVAVIRASASNPTRARQDAQVYAETYVKVRRGQLAEATADVFNQTETEVATVDGQTAALERILVDLNAQIAATYDSVVRNGLENRREELLGQRDTLQRRRSTLQQQLDQLKLVSTTNPTFGVGILSHASDPEKAKGTQSRLVAAAAGLGLVVGLVLALAREHFDDAVKTKRDLEQATGGAPVLGLLPRLRRRLRKVIVTRAKPHSPAAEAYRKLRTSLQLAREGAKARSVMLTSPNPGDGKTTLTANLGVTVASLGRRVLLVDANLHQPRLHELFGLRNDAGLSSVLSGSMSLDQAAQVIVGAGTLTVVTSGPPLNDPAAQLSTDAARRFFGSATETFDVVLVDGPPLLPVTDGLVLAGLVDGVVLVARARRTRADDVTTAMELLEQSSTSFLGTVLSGVDRKEAHVTSYGDRKYKAKDGPRPKPSRDDAAIPQGSKVAQGASDGRW